MVGRDGVAGGSSVLAGKIALSRAIVQLLGKALVCKLGALKNLALQYQSSLLSLLIRHEQAVYAQAQRLAWPRMISSCGSADGCCGRETCQARTARTSGKNS
jgi:hypothetical protein